MTDDRTVSGQDVKGVLMVMQKLLSLVVCLLALCISGIAQSLPRITVDEIREKKPIMEPHLLRLIDREVIYKLSNTTQKRIVVYGTEVEGALQPIRYRLWLNKRLNRWEYPERSGKPVPWKNISSLYKEERILEPGESLLFNGFLSATADCDQFYRVTVQVKLGRSKKTVEILSDDVTVGPCRPAQEVRSAVHGQEDQSEVV